MIVVDGSVWIDNLRNVQNATTAALSASIGTSKQILVGDLILLEILQGARDDLHAQRLRRYLGEFTIVQMVDSELAVSAAYNFRALRSRGITIRKTIDLVIATFCIVHDHELLHSDRDFSPFVQYLGLRLAPV